MDSECNVGEQKFRKFVEPNSLEKHQFSEITNAFNNYTVLSREDILKERKERNKIKKEEKSREREAKFLEEKLKKSDKIRTIVHEDFQKFKTNQQVGQQKSKFKKLQTLNILDFIVTRNGRSKHKLLNVDKRGSKLKINRGKKREKKIKVIRSRLKKAIVKARTARKLLMPNDEIDLNVESGKIKRLDFHKETNSFKNLESNINSHSDIKILENTVCNLEKLKINEDVNQNKNLHSRKFRSYCDNLTSPLLRKLTDDLIRKIYAFQKRAYQKNEIKAKAHRRYVMGFKETKRGLNIEKVKLVIIAPDCEKCDNSDGIEENIDWIKTKCNENEIPYLFSLRARQIAYCLYIKVPVNCIGIISYDGAQDIYNELLNNLAIERENFLKITNDK